MSEVSLLRTDAYDPILLRNNIAEHFRLLRISIPIDMRVVIKPNLIMRCDPTRAATLHPAIMEAVLAQLRDMGVRDIIIAESPGGHFTPNVLKALFDKTGIATVAEKYGVPCSLSTESHILRREANTVCREFDILAPITEDVFLVNLCKVKTHSMMTFSGGVKNLFGCIPGLLKPQLHYRFPEEEKFAAMLVDLSQTLHPNLTIADGVIGMEGDGPTGGTPRELGITAAACFDGLYALDELLVHMIGIPAEKVPTIMEVRKRELSQMPIVLGNIELASKVIPFILPKGKSLDFSAHAGVFAPIVRMLKPYLAPRPKIQIKHCIGCGKCAQTCPAHVIIIKDGKAKINPNGCIRCFCCHEMCPERAINIREIRLFRMRQNSANS